MSSIIAAATPPFALKEDGYETVMVNCNPETVSTDYDTSDRLYFEPLTLEDVLAVLDREKPQGVIVQFGGQTPLNLALELKRNGAKIIGTDPESIDLAEDRRRFGAASHRTRDSAAAQRHRPRAGRGRAGGLRNRAAGAGAPELRARRPLHGDRLRFEDRAGIRGPGRADRHGTSDPKRPILIDQFLEDATEVDVDALADGEDVVIAGIMEHIEEAGIHSGDSSCVLPAVSLKPSVLERIRDYTSRLAKALHVVGLMNVQYAIQHDTVYVLEVNPRASRTIPYVSKATGVPLAKVAARLMTGRKLRDLNLPFIETNGIKELAVHDFYAVKSPVFPFNKFRGVDPVLGPEMRSTGEVMGVSSSFGMAFAKAQLAAGQRLPQKGIVFMSVSDHDKKNVAPVANDLVAAGLKIIATRGTAAALRARGNRSGSGLQGERRPPEYRGPDQNRQSQSADQYAARPRILL